MNQINVSLVEKLIQKQFPEWISFRSETSKV